MFYFKRYLVNMNTTTPDLTKMLLRAFADWNKFEVGVDEAGRGPMFGRVYTAAVILPKDSPNFRYDLLKDSKKFHSEQKIQQVAEYIKSNALAWSVTFSCEKTIDLLNIRVATFQSMHKSVRQVIEEHLHRLEEPADVVNYHLLVDGNDFKPLIMFNKQKCMQSISHTCIEGGDNKYCSIAAASILAKVARDNYIADLCKKTPELIEKYDLLKNKGYGTAKHLAGIREHGITPFHRKTFGVCKEF